MQIETAREEARTKAEAFLRGIFVRRARESHKGTYGKAVLCCGSSSYPGAALLAAGGAVRAGAGLVYLLAPQEVLLPVRVRLPEVIGRVMPPLSEEPATYAAFLSEQQTGGAILIGCGIGRGKTDRFVSVLRELLAMPGVPLVLDADGLNMLAEEEDRGAYCLHGAKRAIVLTPHPLEFSRLTGISVKEIQEDRSGHARAYAEQTGAVLVLKGADSVIACPDGRVWVNPTGSPALSKGGSGDVLAGLLTGLLAQGIDTYEATCAAVCLHGLAGERLGREYSEYGVLPSDLAEAAAREIARLQEGALC